MEKSAADYENRFDVDIYLRRKRCADRFFKSEVVAPKHWQFWHEVFTPGKIPGDRLLDVGSGPCIDTAIPASRCFTEIYMSDISSKCRTAIQDWVDRKPGCHDWTSYMEKFASLEGLPAKVIEERTRSSIKKALHCDVISSNPLAPEQVEPFDCLTSSLCLEAASKDEAAYRQNIRNISSLLKSGGTLILMGVLESTEYFVGDAKFCDLPLKMPFIEEVLTENGYEITKKMMLRDEVVSEAYGIPTCFYVVALKTEK